MRLPDIEVQPTLERFAAAACERIVQRFYAAVAEKDTFTLCLTGGRTARQVYEVLARDEYARRIEWPRVELFWGDERAVPPDHAESNFGMAKAALLDRLPTVVPGDNVYRIKGELEPEAAAKAYGLMLKEKFGPAEAPGFDLLLLGMGEDAHTLSLFPRTAAIDEAEHRCVANFVPKLSDGRGAWRITLTAPFANRSRHVLTMVTGAPKATAVRDALEGDADPRDCPIKLIQPRDGTHTMLLDSGAAGMEEDE